MQRRRPARACAAHSRRGRARPARDVTRHETARRGDGRGHLRRRASDSGGHRLLRRGGCVHAGVGSAARRGVDRGARPVVRGATRPRAVPRPVSRASRADPAGSRRLGGSGRRGRAGPSTTLRACASCARPRPVRAGRAPPAPRRLRVRRSSRIAPPANRAGNPRREWPCCASRQGRIDAAVAAGRRMVEESRGQFAYPKMLAACVDILLAAGEVDTAGALADELATVAATADAPLPRATGAYAAGSVLLAAGDPGAALVELRRAHRAWRDLEVPYEAARTRVQIGLSCRALGDEDAAKLELDAARADLRATRCPQRPGPGRGAHRYPPTRLARPT